LLASGSNDQIYEFWLELLEIPEARATDKLRADYDRIFQLKASGYAPVLPELDSFLQQLKKSGLLLGVATMDDESNALQTLDALGCANRFDFVCGADSGYGVKPQPGMVDAFCESTGLKPIEVMMVGDSPRDLDMGRAAGVGMNVGVLTGTTSRADLAGLADVVMDNISGIANLFE